MIIGFTGKKGSGKDTAAAHLVNKYGFTRVSFADKLKKSASACFGVDPNIWDRLKNDPFAEIRIVNDDEPWGTIATVSLRQFLQKYGTEAHRDIFGYNFWVEAAIRDLPEGNIAFTDVRFDNEALAILEMDGVIIEVDRGLPEIDAHISEQGINPEYITGVLYNKGSLENLQHALDAYIVANAHDLHK